METKTQQFQTDASTVRTSTKEVPPGSNTGTLSQQIADLINIEPLDNQKKLVDEFNRAIKLNPWESVIPWGEVKKVRGKKQLSWRDYYYSSKEAVSKLSKVYYCNKNKSHQCRARIRYYPKYNVYVHAGEHVDHSATPVKAQQSTPSLDLSRLAILDDFVEANTHIRSSRTIAEMLNAGLTAEQQKNPRFKITMKDVQSAQLRYERERRYRIQDVHYLSELAMTKSRGTRERFVRWVSTYPHTLMIWASDYQMNILRTATRDDEFFIDGTFDRRAEGFGQMLTIMLRKKEQERAIPCLFSFLNRENAEKDCWFLWWTIKYLVPELGNIQKIQMTVHYDKEMHNAIKTHWPDAQIVGCLFHQQQAIDEWIKQGVYKEHVLKSNSSVSLSLKQDIKILACSNFTSDDQFQRVVNQFVTKWRPIAGEKFMNYMIKTWLGNAQITPRFGPEIWAQYKTPRTGPANLQQTNNTQIEMFHQQVTSLFSTRPPLKKGVQLWQQLEREYSEREVNERSRPSTTTTATAPPTTNSNVLNNAMKRPRPSFILIEDVEEDDASSRKKQKLGEVQQ